MLRIMIVDGGYSSTPRLVGSQMPRRMTSELLQNLQAAAKADVILVCGASPKAVDELVVAEMLREWAHSFTSNNCSGNLALVNGAKVKTPFCAISLTLSANQGREAQLVTLEVDGEPLPLTILFTKIHHGSRAANCQYDADQRTVVWDTLFDTLNHLDGPWVACGALGSTPWCRRLGIHGARWSRPLQDFSEDGQDYGCVSGFVCGSVASKLMLDEDAHTLVLDLPCAAPASGEKPAKRNRTSAPETPTETLTQQFATQLDLVDGDEAVLLMSLFRGRKQIMYTPDGHLLQRPSSMQEKAAAAGLVLQVLHDARQAVGCVAGSLDEKQKKNAYDWLRNQWQARWSNNMQLQRDIRALEAGEINERKEKKRIRSLRGSAFNAFLHQFAGDPRVFRILLNEGFATVGEWRGLMEELRLYLQDPEYQRRRDRTRAQIELKRAASAARRRYHEAKKIDHKLAIGEWSHASLSPQQVSILDNIYQLRQEMLSANKAYGFGLGSEEFLPDQERIAIEYTTKGLRDYFAAAD